MFRYSKFIVMIYKLKINFLQLQIYCYEFLIENQFSPFFGYEENDYGVAKPVRFSIYYSKYLQYLHKSKSIWNIPTANICPIQYLTQKYSPIWNIRRANILNISNKPKIAKIHDFVKVFQIYIHNMSNIGRFAQCSLIDLQYSKSKDLPDSQVIACK